MHVREQLVADTFHHALRHRDHDKVVGEGGADAEQVKARDLQNGEAEFGEQVDTGFRHGFDVIVDEGLQEQRALHVRKRAYGNAEHHEDKRNDIRQKYDLEQADRRRFIQFRAGAHGCHAAAGTAGCGRFFDGCAHCSSPPFC